MARQICAINGCDRPMVGHGYCATHYCKFIARSKFQIGVIAPEIEVMLQEYLHGEDTQLLAKKYNLSSRTISTYASVYRQVNNLPKRSQKREASAAWKGGRRITSKGYVMVYCNLDDPIEAAMHPASERYVGEHRLVMAHHLGRPLTSKETVHHKDLNRSNNDISNLQLRQGKHGSGAVFRCRACGSHDIEAVELAGV